MSTNALKGAFELLVKVYDGGALSQQLATMALGATMDFKHIPFNVKRQYPFGAKHDNPFAFPRNMDCNNMRKMVLRAEWK